MVDQVTKHKEFVFHTTIMAGMLGAKCGAPVIPEKIFPSWGRKGKYCLADALYGRNPLQGKILASISCCVESLDLTAFDKLSAAIHSLPITYVVSANNEIGKSFLRMGFPIRYLPLGSLREVFEPRP